MAIILGRTTYTAEQNSHLNLLEKTEYYSISHLARDFLIQNSIHSLPVSLNTIIKNNHWQTISYDKLKTIDNDIYNNLMKNNLGFTIATDNNQYFICYDDRQSIRRQRFTIAHEIGHIALKHFNSNSIYREQEASIFAAKLLMPMCVLYECKVASVKEIKELCLVSKISAQYRFEHLEMLKKRNKFYTDKN